MRQKRTFLIEFTQKRALRLRLQPMLRVPLTPKYEARGRYRKCGSCRSGTRTTDAAERCAGP
jgi:hypothetical protein